MIHFFSSCHVRNPFELILMSLWGCSFTSCRETHAVKVGCFVPIYRIRYMQTTNSKMEEINNQMN